MKISFFKFFKNLSYTFKVKFIKIFLLLLISSLILSFIALPAILIKLKSLGPLAEVLIDNMLSKTIKPPVLSGTAENGYSYYLTADKVTNTLFSINTDKPKIIYLNNLFLIVNSPENLLINVSSKLGIFNPKSKSLSLPGSVYLYSTHEDSIILEEALINLKAQYLISNKPIIYKDQSKTLTAKGLKIYNSWQSFLFKGPVLIKSEETTHKALKKQTQLK